MYNVIGSIPELNEDWTTQKMSLKNLDLKTIKTAAMPNSCKFKKVQQLLQWNCHFKTEFAVGLVFCDEAM